MPSPSRPVRRPQLAYSEHASQMLVEGERRVKGRRIVSVLTHFLGSPDLRGLVAVDVGCSAGFIADELAAAGARTIGLDIDVPGLRRAYHRFGPGIRFMCADGGALPLADESVDVLVLNHVYEHAIDPERLFAELYRVLKPTGVGYLALGNRLGVVEPHYRLPFLSYLSPSLADRYLRLTRRGDHYHERFLTRRGLRRLVRDFHVWDYTVTVLAERDRFESSDVVPGPVRRLPPAALRAALPLVPTYVWVAAKSPSAPRGSRLAGGPVKLTG